MFSIIKIIIFLVLLNSSSYAVNQFHVFAVNCGGQYELYDYKELYSLNSEYRYDINGQSLKEKISLLLKRIKKFSPPHYKLYKDWYNTLLKNLKYTGVIPYQDSLDLLSFIRWNNCHLESLIKVTKKNQFPEIIVSRPIWEKLDDKNKAGALLNILINLENIFILDKENTQLTRFFNAFITTNDFASITSLNTLVNLHHRLGYPSFFYKGVFYRLWLNDIWSPRISLSFNRDGIVIGSPTNEPDYHHNISSFTFTNAPSFKTQVKSLSPLEVNIWQISREKVIRNMTRSLVYGGCVGDYKIPKNTLIDLKLEALFVDKQFQMKILSIKPRNLHYKHKAVSEISYRNNQFLISTTNEIRDESRFSELKKCR